MGDNFCMVDCGENGADQGDTLSGAYWRAWAEDCLDTHNHKRQNLPSPRPPRHSCWPCGFHSQTLESLRKVGISVARGSFEAMSGFKFTRTHHAKVIALCGLGL